MMGNYCLRSRPLKRARLTLAFAAASLTVTLGAAPIPPAEKLLPEDTLVVLTAPDAARMREFFKQTPQQQFWRDPAMKPFRDKFMAKWGEEVVKPLERDLGIRFSDYAALPQGQITFALTQNGWDAKSDAEPAFLLLLDVKEKSDQLKTNLADVRKRWVDAGKMLRTEKIRDVEFAFLTLTSNDVPETLRRFLPGQGDEVVPEVEAPAEGSEPNKKPAAKEELAVGQFESLLILGDSVKALEKVVARLTGGSVPVLGEVAAFEADRMAHFREATLYGWVNTKIFADIVSKLPQPEVQPDQPPPLPISTVLKAVGLLEVKTLAFSLQDTGAGSLLNVAIGAPEASRVGLLRILTVEAKDAAPPAFVPADAVKFLRIRIDGQKAWAAIEKAVGDISPAWSGALNMFLKTGDVAGKQINPDFSIRQNLIGNLGDELISWDKPSRGKTLDDLRNAPSITLVGSPNPDKLASSFTTLLGGIPQGGTPKEREFLGRKIYTFTPPAFTPPDNPEGTPTSVSYAASGGYVGFSKDVALLEEWLRSSENPPKPLRDTPGLTEAIQKAGGADKGWLAYENQSANLRVVFSAFKNDPEAALNASLGLPLRLGFNAGPDAWREWFDFALLPEWDAVAKYFNFTILSAGSTADGVSFRFYNPTPQGTNKGS